MRTLHQSIDQIGRKTRQRRDAERGFSLPEVLFVLTLAALGVLGAVTLFNTARDRITANRHNSSLQPWMVDTAVFSTQYFAPVPGSNGVDANKMTFEVGAGGATGPLHQGDSSAVNITVSCGSWVATCPTGAGGDACRAVKRAGCTSITDITPPNANMRRLLNTPSIQLEGGKQEITISRDETVQVAWVIQPLANSLDTAAEYGFTATGALAAAGCDVAGAATDLNNPTAVAFVMALDVEKGICDSIAEGTTQQEHVSQADCFDDTTTPTWSNANIGEETAESAMVVCITS